MQCGLDHTVRGIHGDPPELDPEEPVSEQDFEFDDEQVQARHISGADLCLGLRDYAVGQYGLMARSVLRHWHINTCEDFGHIVFAMVEAGLMFKTEEDSIKDFQGVYDFSNAFSPRLQLDEKR